MLVQVSGYISGYKLYGWNLQINTPSIRAFRKGAINCLCCDVTDSVRGDNVGGTVTKLSSFSIIRSSTALVSLRLKMSYVSVFPMLWLIRRPWVFNCMRVQLCSVRIGWLFHWWRNCCKSLLHYREKLFRINHPVGVIWVNEVHRKTDTPFLGNNITVAEPEQLTIWSEAHAITTTPHCLLKKRVPIKLGHVGRND